jgi:hypothetical protein
MWNGNFKPSCGCGAAAKQSPIIGGDGMATKRPPIREALAIAEAAVANIRNPR